MLAVNKVITRRVDVHSLRHSTQIEYFDTAVIFASSTKALDTASGFTRLSWETDGWATGPVMDCRNQDRITRRIWWRDIHLAH